MSAPTSARSWSPTAWPARVVDALELVDVDEHQRERRAVAPGALDHPGDGLLEGAVVAQARSGCRAARPRGRSRRARGGATGRPPARAAGRRIWRAIQIVKKHSSSEHRDQGRQGLDRHRDERDRRRDRRPASHRSRAGRPRPGRPNRGWPSSRGRGPRRAGRSGRTSPRTGRGALRTHRRGGGSRPGISMPGVATASSAGTDSAATSVRRALALLMGRFDDQDLGLRLLRADRCEARDDDARRQRRRGRCRSRSSPARPRRSTSDAPMMTPPGRQVELLELVRGRTASGCRGILGGGREDRLVGEQHLDVGRAPPRPRAAAP